MVYDTDFPTADGTAVRDYIHVSDVVDAHIAAIETGEHPGEAKLYNIGVGKGYSVKQVVDACLKVTGADIKVEMMPRRPGDYAEVYSDPAKINRELKWRAKFSNLTEALATGWRWRKRNPNGYSGWNRPAFIKDEETGTQGFYSRGSL